MCRRSAQTLAKLLKVNEKEILFTSGGTESDNLAIIGGAEANKRMGNHIITTAVEHAAVAQPFAYLKDQGYEVHHPSCGSSGSCETGSAGSSSAARIRSWCL